jgi:hypothetical protein
VVKARIERASRSFSTSSTTTRQRGITSAPP